MVTLTNLYNEMPTWLKNAHRKLDEAVFAAYGWMPDLSDDDILSRLLDLNLSRTVGVEMNELGTGTSGGREASVKITEVACDKLE
jgi:hypothetical protein